MRVCDSLFCKYLATCAFPDRFGKEEAGALIDRQGQCHNGYCSTHPDTG